MSLLLQLNKQDKSVKSPVRWVGGKSWLVNTIKEILPTNYNNYHEPFVGGGALFFSINPTKAFLSDLNADLINFYRQLRKDPNGLIEGLLKLQINRKEFYKIRSDEPKSVLDKAIRFLYLNKTCFNGIYRVNTQGKFNVPYGVKKSVVLANTDELLSASIILQNARLRNCDFMETLKDIKKDDLVFIDPPYTVAHNFNGFLEYNQRIFNWDDQERLLQYIKKIISTKAFFILTNADHQSIRNLYGGIGKTLVVERNSTISAQTSKRKLITELIITNCI